MCIEALFGPSEAVAQSLQSKDSTAHTTLKCIQVLMQQMQALKENQEIPPEPRLASTAENLKLCCWTQRRHIGGGDSLKAGAKSKTWSRWNESGFQTRKHSHQPKLVGTEVHVLQTTENLAAKNYKPEEADTSVFNAQQHPVQTGYTVPALVRSLISNTPECVVLIFDEKKQLQLYPIKTLP